MKKTFIISPRPLGLEDLKYHLDNRPLIALSEESKSRILRCKEYLDRKMLSQEEPLYGITTGFGSLCSISIPRSDLSLLQLKLVMSHACGMGDRVPDDIVRLMLLLKIHGLSLGYSGVQLATVERLIQFYNHDILPIVYEQGSLGASGDLAPLAHLSLPLLGLGEVKIEGQIVPGEELAARFGWQPMELQAKEGLALLNGTQFMSAYASYILIKSSALLRWSDITASLSLEAYNGRIEPFDARIHDIRPHPGQAETARNVRKLLESSSLITSVGKAVQDPYSFRCIPQVHGASKDAFRHVRGVILTEINSVSDNPTLFPSTDGILSGGNFHGEPLALALDYLGIALAETGNISERRVYRLISGQRGLPPFLVAHPGLNSGFMIPQYSDASLVSQNKQLATPASVDSITSSNEQEDHVSMGANAATKTLRILNNLEKILAIEWFAAAQALEFRRPKTSSPLLEGLVAQYRKVVPFMDEDGVLFTQINASRDFITGEQPEEILAALEPALAVPSMDKYLIPEP